MAMMSMMNISLKRHKKGWHLLPFFYAETDEIPGLPGPDEARKDKQAKVVLRTSFHHFCLLVWRGERSEPAGTANMQAKKDKQALVL